MRLIGRLTPLNRFYLASGLAFTYFWVAIAIPYLTYRQISLPTALFLLSAYNIVSSLLEYPTGVWADVHGYKKSQVLGFASCITSYLFFLLPGGILTIIIGLGFLAFGVAMMSGSDYGLLYGLSTNQKQAISNYKFIADMMLFVSAFISGWLFKINPWLPFIINLGVWVVGIAIMTTVPETRVTKNQANIFLTAKQGLVSVRSHQILLGLTILFTVVYGIALCIKHIFGSLTVLFDLQPEILGMVIGIGAFVRAWGAKAYSKLDLPFGPILIFLALSLGISGWWPVVSGVIISLLLFQLVVGFFIAKIDHQFQVNCQDEVRASVFSLRRLTSRLFSSLYLLIFSLFLSRSTFGYIMLFSAMGIIAIFLIVKSLLVIKTVPQTISVDVDPDKML